MSAFVRAGTSLVVMAMTAGLTLAAPQRDIDNAIAKGAEFLKKHYAKGIPQSSVNGENYGIGPACLTGLALLEAKVPANDPVIQMIAKAVREASYGENKTYQIALCLIFLDHLENPEDVPLIQMLAVRLLAGQMSNGGWGYNCGNAISGETQQWLRANVKVSELVAGKDNGKDPKAKATPRMSAEVLKYAATLTTNQSGPAVGDDNSNTQFGLLACWVARKHGAPVDGALDLVEKRFRASQDPQLGGWQYMPLAGGGLAGGAGAGAGGGSTPSMTCAGLLGLAVGTARRVAAPHKEPPPKEPKKGDPFFNNPNAPKETPAKKPTLDAATQRAIAFLGASIAAQVRNGGLLAGGQVQGDRDYYTLWSYERVGVIYGLEKFGDVDWYELGSDVLVKAQGGDGSWSAANYGTEVNTCFAVLFLCRADLARDLSSKFRGKDNELRAGTSGAVPSGTGNTSTAPMPKNPGSGGTTLPMPVEDDATRMASQLIQSAPSDWTKALEKLRDTKGSDNTKSLVIAIHRLDGERKKEVREALAERLTRMSAETLKGMMTNEDAEFRRGAVLAAAMKDDRTHVPDLIDRLTDDEELVVRAAKAGLKSLTSQDFGPKNGATKDECKAAADAWKAWWSKQKP